MNFFIKKGNVLPDLKYPLTQQMLSKYDITRDMMENVAVTFSMVDMETGRFRVANVGGKLTINKPNDYEKLDDTTYELVYCFKTRDTAKIGEYLGEFKLDFLGDHSGGIIFPVNNQIKIHIERNLVKTSFVVSSLINVELFDETFDYTFG